MNFKHFLNDINLNCEDKYYLILLLIFAISLTFVMIKFSLTRGALNWDIYAYLASALDFANMDYNNISDKTLLFCSPVITYLTSILFRFGFVSIKSIFLVTGIFGIFGIFGMYTFLKVRFSPLLSFTGAILYSSFSLTLLYYSNGMLDTSAVAIILWVFIFTFAAVNKNYKYYILVAFFFVISIFTRYTCVYISSLIILFIFKEHDLVNLFECLIYDRTVFKKRLLNFLKGNEFKWMCISAIIGATLIFSFIYLLLSHGSQLEYFAMAKGSIQGLPNKLDDNYVQDKLFYIKNFINLLFCDKIIYVERVERFLNVSWASYFVISILSCGLIIKLINIFKNKNFFKENRNQIQFRTKRASIFLWILMCVLFVISIITFKFNYLYSLVLLWMCFVILISLIKEFPVNKNNFAVSLLCFGLFSFYLIIFSYQDLKCVRYILLAFPAFAYFVIYSLENIINFINTGWEDEKILSDRLSNDKSILIVDKSDLKHKISIAIPIVLIIICLFMAFNFPNTVELEDRAVYVDSVANYLIEHDSNYDNASIGITFGIRYFQWYFMNTVDKISLEDNDSLNYSYIITHFKWENENYTEIYNEGWVHLYENKYI